VRALGQLGEAAGKTASEIGLIGTAGLVLGAAIGGWKIGRAIADFFSLDEAIGNATAKLLGWGDAQAAASGARGDVLALATQRSGHAVTDLTEAMRINDEWFKKHQKGAVDAAKATEDWNKAMVELNSSGEGWQGTLDTIDGETVDAIRSYLDAGVATSALATAYGLTDAQMKAITSSMAAAKEATAALAEEDRKALHELDELIASYEKLHVLTLNNDRKIQADTAKVLAEQTAIVNAGVTEALTLQTAYNKTMGLDASGAVLLQVTALDVLNARLAEIAAMHTTAQAKTTLSTLANKDFENASLADAKAIDAEFAALRKNNEELSKVPALKQAAMSLSFNTPLGGSSGGTTDPSIQRWLDQGYTINEAMALAGGYGSAILGHAGAAALASGHRAAGGPVSGGSSYLVGERGPELFTPGSSGFISPNGGGAVNVTIFVNGTAAEVARQVAAEILRTVKQGKQLGSA
jgi:hypothetical protein